MDETKSNLVVRGPDDNSNVPRKSFGKICFDVLKSSNKEKVLIIDGVSDQKVTNGEYLQQCIKISKWLENVTKIKKGDVVAIISENNIWYPVAVLGVLFTGATLNTLNPVYTSGELIHLLRLSKPRIIFCSEAVVETLTEVLKTLDSVDEVIVLSENENLQQKTIKQILTETNADDIDSFEPKEVDFENDTAIILCSSGTTGFPKGVALTHKNLRITLVYMSDPYHGGSSAADVAMVLLPIFHVVGFLNMFISIYNNCLIILLNAFKPKLFLESIEKYGITLMSIVPSILEFLAKGEIVSNYKLHTLKTIYCGGYTLSKSTEEILKKRLNITGVRQLYGLTEVSGACTMQPKLRPEMGGCGVVLHSFSIKICHLTTGKALRRGEVGEIRVKGDGVMKEYILNPEETNSSFDEDGYFKTGDVGYFDDNGCLFIVDRLKELIKYKGFQVPPAEIESILQSHPSIIEAAVVGIPDERAGELPTAFVVKDKNSNLIEKDICDFVAEKVSIQKRLHGGVKFLEKLPRSLNGKILRKALREMSM